MKNPKIVRVKTGETPTLKLGEMLLDKENNILYIGIGDKDICPDEKKEV